MGSNMIDTEGRETYHSWPVNEQYAVPDQEYRCDKCASVRKWSRGMFRYKTFEGNWKPKTPETPCLPWNVLKEREPLALIHEEPEEPHGFWDYTLIWWGCNIRSGAYGVRAQSYRDRTGAKVPGDRIFLKGTPEERDPNLAVKLIEQEWRETFQNLLIAADAF